MGSNRQIDNIVLYDGVCQFCNASVNFILKYERQPELSFCSLQSEYGKEILKRFHLPIDYTDSLLLLSKDNLYSKSIAVFRIAGFLLFPFSSFQYFKFIPTFLTDSIYNLVARNRFLFLGKKDECPIPSEKLRNRFVN
jgi:predicted DCC family thiol-disulfide oxidoreductase YuxK